MLISTTLVSRVRDSMTNSGDACEDLVGGVLVWSRTGSRAPRAPAPRTGHGRHRDSGNKSPATPSRSDAPGHLERGAAPSGHRNEADRRLGTASRKYSD